MSNILDPHYSDLGGLDTSTNKMSQNPKTARAGSKNFEYSVGDPSNEYTQRKGYQHKSISTYGAECGLIEYKFKNINTGESESIILGVGSDGNLRKRISNSLKITKSSGSADTYSVYYDEVALNWKLVIYDSALAVLGTTSMTTTTTLTTLVTNLTALAIAGLAFDVVDNDGASLSGVSALKAYLLDVVINKSILTGSTLNPVYDWELVPNAGLDYNNSPLSATYPCPFPNAKAGFLDEEWKGVSYTNLNNICYITDGGFLMKYDGKSVYRAGMPRFTEDLGFADYLPATDAAGELTENKNYKYIYQYGHVDQNGLEVLGQIVETDFFSYLIPLGFHSIFLPIYPIGGVENNGDFFPVYSCKVAAQITLTGTGSMTITVDTGHNIKVGMCLRFHIRNPSLSGWSWAYYKVSAITSNTITFNKTINNHYFPINAAGAELVLANADDTVNVLRINVVLNGCYVPTDWEGTATEPYLYYVEGVQYWAPTPIYGAFCRLYRTQGDGETFYRLADVAISHQEDWTIKDQLRDIASGVNQGLTTIPADFTLGQEIPRACGFVTQFQNQLIQGGRPYAPTTIINVPYPWYFGTAPTTGGLWGFPINDAPWVYTEANLCDFQSIYWSDALAFEGFPNSGLNEESFESTFKDQVNGAYQNKDVLFVFKDRTTGFLSGTLATGNLTKEILEADVGAVNQGCLQDVNGSVVFLDRTQGFFAVTAGRLPIAIGEAIQDYFQDNKTNPRLQKFNLNRVQSTNYKLDNKYICYVPAGVNENGDTANNPYPTSYSTTFVFDYTLEKGKARNCWYFWDNINAIGGVLATSTEELLTAELVDSATQILWKQKFTKTKYDMSDHTSAISFIFNTAWLTYGLRSVDKHFIGAWINSISGGFTLTVKQYGDWVEAALGSIAVIFSSSTTKVKPKQQVHLNQPKLTAFSLGFENSTVNQLVKIDGFDLELVSEYDLKEPRT